MTKTRHSIFETNSSSVHTLTLGSQPTPKIIDDETLETIYLGSGSYGWGYEKLTTWMEKADYLAIEAIEDEAKKEMLFGALLIAYPKYLFKFDEDDDGEASGYIDHQSYEEVWSELNSTEEVFAFLFGSSDIKIDNDNH